MNKLLKILGVLALLIVLAVVVLTLVVRSYLTGERVKAMLIPQVEEALGRTVTMGEVDIGLFRGVSISDFAVKEDDGKTDFVNVKNFVLSYDLVPILKRKLVVSEFLFQEPTVRIHRDAQGRFNFKTLKKRGRGASEKKPGAGAKAVAAPIALTVEQIRVDGARLMVSDDLGLLPSVDAHGDLEAKIDVGLDPSSLQYSGSLVMSADAVKGDQRTTLKGEGRFNQENLGFRMDMKIGEDTARAEGEIKGYRDVPMATLDLRSEALDLQRLLAMVESISGGGEKPGKKKKTRPKNAPKKTASSQAGEPKPSPGPSARGTVEIGRAAYGSLELTDLSLNYRMERGRLSVKDVQAVAYGGEIDGAAVMDFNKPDPAYNGRLKVQGVEAAELMPALAPGTSGVFSGKIGTSFSFSGVGTGKKEIEKYLTASGDYGLAGGSIGVNPINESVAGLLGLPELRELTSVEMKGRASRKPGRPAVLKSGLTSSSVELDTKGAIGLDGTIDLPVTLYLSPGLSEKLRSKASFTRYLADEEGRTVVGIRLSGTLGKPRPGLDREMVKDKSMEVLEKKAMDELDKSLSDKEIKGLDTDTAKDLLKGLFKK
jgi:AsmA protein